MSSTRRPARPSWSSSASTRKASFSGQAKGKRGRFDYRLRFRAGEAEWERDDPYAFGPVLGEMDEYLIAEGRHEDLYSKLGAHPETHEGVDGVNFAVWAPNARRVSVVGHFNAWDGRRHVMRKRWGSGIWELFVPGIQRGEIYKYEIIGAYGETLPLKADPIGLRAGTAAADRFGGHRVAEIRMAGWRLDRAAQ